MPDVERRPRVRCLGTEYVDRGDHDQQCRRLRFSCARAFQAVHHDGRLVRRRVEVAENASDTLLERITLRRTGSASASRLGHNTAVPTRVQGGQGCRLWAVRSASDSHDDSSDSRQQVTEDTAGIVAGNIPVLIERNDFINATSRTCTVVPAR